jgi:hypothetical protein
MPLEDVRTHETVRIEVGDCLIDVDGIKLTEITQIDKSHQFACQLYSDADQVSTGINPAHCFACTLASTIKMRSYSQRAHTITPILTYSTSLGTPVTAENAPEILRGSDKVALIYILSMLDAARVHFR